MDLKTRVSTFLDNPSSPYSDGVAILEAVGLADGFRRVGHITPSDRDRLREKLEALAAILDNQPGSEAPAVRTEAPADGDQVQRLREQAKALHKRQSFVHARMVEISSHPDGPERKKQLYELAAEMMTEIVPALDRIYDNIRNFERTGELLYPISSEATKTADLVRARNTERTNASRWRKLIRANEDNPEKLAYYQNKLGESLARIRDLEETIKNW